MRHDAELVELFEYKVADVQRGREPRGGKRGIAELREYLLGASLDPVMMRRVRAADRLWRAAVNGTTPTGRHMDGEQIGALGLMDMGELELGKLSAVPESLKTQLGQLKTKQVAAADTAAPPGERNEWEVLGQLRAALFHADLRSRARQQARIWLKEPRLSTIRLAYALTENMDRGGPGTAVPPLHDAFSSLHDPDIAAQVLSTLARQLSVQAGELSRRYVQVKSALTQLADTPFPRSPQADVMDAQVQAAEHEQLSFEVRQALVQALQRGPDAPRSAAERPPIRSAASRLLAFLESVIPVSSGGQGLEWPLLDGLLFARSQALRLPEPSAQALSLAIHLPGGEQTHWRGQPITWKAVLVGKTEPQPGWEVRLSEAEVSGEVAESGAARSMNIVRLSAQRPDAESQFAGQPVRLSLIGGDLALELRPVTHTDLFPLAVEARLTAALLEPSASYTHLRLARAVAQRLRGGEINPEKVSAQSAERYASAPPETLLTFARQGAQTLLAYAARGDDEALSRAFAEARTFLQLSRVHGEALLDLVRLSLHVEALAVIDNEGTEGGLMEVEGEQYALLLFRGQPITVRVRGRPVTLRSDYKGDLCAVMAGAPAAPVRDLLVIPLPQGAITILRLGERVAVGFQPLLEPAP
ncbi:hypothetical protein GCM10022631_41290 [Deinococcus rubellus]|uniref:Uncharacterized protein n=1 Tax=Deinococcus rubellus TaxID=1889240 RepID=A0ABY5YG35_9DEIO|nr:hypothetical protein [Deinococcus rubellus]UWX63911.1 hypothetical protein N0D28_14500 [Deinococcus rubellus]